MFRSFDSFYLSVQFDYANFGQFSDPRFNIEIFVSSAVFDFCGNTLREAPASIMLLNINARPRQVWSATTPSQNAIFASWTFRFHTHSLFNVSTFLESQDRKRIESRSKGLRFPCPAVILRGRGKDSRNEITFRY